MYFSESEFWFGKTYKIRLEISPGQLSTPELSTQNCVYMHGLAFWFLEVESKFLHVLSQTFKLCICTVQRLRILVTL